MKRICYLFLPALLMLVPTHSAAQTYGDLDTEFRISLSKRSKPPAGIQADLVTTTTYPCAGYVMRTRVSWTRDTINVRILGFTRPQPCYQGNTEATGKAFLGDLEEGEYFVRFFYRGEADLYNLIIESKRMTALPVRTHFTEIKVKGS